MSDYIRMIRTCMPAPPEQSLPAMVNTAGKLEGARPLDLSSEDETFFTCSDISQAKF